MTLKELSSISWEIGTVSGVLQGIEMTTTLLPNQKEAIANARKSIQRIEEWHKAKVVELSLSPAPKVNQQVGANVSRSAEAVKIWSSWIRSTGLVAQQIPDSDLNNLLAQMKLLQSSAHLDGRIEQAKECLITCKKLQDQFYSHEQNEMGRETQACCDNLQSLLTELERQRAP